MCYVSYIQYAVDHFVCSVAGASKATLPVTETPESMKPELPPSVRAGDMPFPQRLAFMALDESDALRVRQLLATFEEKSQDFTDQFYSHLLQFPETAKFIRDPTLVERLKELQKNHLRTMLEARWDDAYLQGRLRIGDRHAEVGIEPQFFLGAYNQYIQFFYGHFANRLRQDGIEPMAHLLTLDKLILLDIGLTLDAYFAHSTKALRDALDMLWRANNELRQFAQLASHDLKTPLATVANLCEEALDEFRDQIPDAAVQLIEKARQRTFRMSAMIDELLSAMADAGQTELCAEVDSQQVLDEAVERIRPLLKPKGIELSIESPMPVVWCNRVRLREAFYNLLSNAIKFVDKRPGRITVAFRLSAEQCTFIISDNGPGIPKEELDRIFAPFRRLPKHRELPGSGLGLYFTKNLIEQQGGRVWVESSVGAGSSFFIELFRRRPPAEHPLPEADHSTKAPRQPQPTNK